MSPGGSLLLTSAAAADANDILGRERPRRLLDEQWFCFPIPGVSPTDLRCVSSHVPVFPCSRMLMFLDQWRMGFPARACERIPGARPPPLYRCAMDRHTSPTPHQSRSCVAYSDTPIAWSVHTIDYTPAHKCFGDTSILPIAQDIQSSH
eukprot:COSAG02_NODE_23178_length_727_cov_1.146497_1_plen_149_part_00